MSTYIRLLLFTCSIIAFCFLFSPIAATAQVAEPHMLSLQEIGGSNGDKVTYFVSKTPDGGFILVLGSNSATGPICDSFCTTIPSTRNIQIKYNSDASLVEWSKCYAGTWSDSGYGFMFQTVDNHFVIGGSANSGNKWLVRKEDNVGNVLWTKAYGGSSSQMLEDMLATDDGGYILFGSAHGGDGDIGFHYGSFFTRDFWVLKVDADGRKMWSKVYGGTGEDVGASILKAPGGGYYIVGTTTSTDYDCMDNHGSGDVFIARLNADGDMIWRRCLGGTNSEGGDIEGCRATLDGKGGVLIAAQTSSADGDVSHKIATGVDFWLVSIDSANNILWDNCYGGAGTECPNSVCKATDGSIWMMGRSRTAGGQVNESYGGNSDAYVVHTDSMGVFLNARVLGSSGQDMGYLVYPLKDGLILGGGYYAAANGSFSTFQGGQTDAFLVKFTNWANDIVEVMPSGAVSVYPNPAKDIVRVAGADNIQYNIAISDITGRLVYSGGLWGNTQISVAHWQAGMYYVHTIGADGHNTIRKLIIQ